MPYDGLVFDGAGNLYGTTLGGGATDGVGTVFKLTHNSDGTWTESVLHSFSGPDGGDPQAGVIFDAAGNLYGCTIQGGTSNAGTVFKLKPNADGTWTESVLHSFSGSDGSYPIASLAFDGAGNLYGTTYFGGANNSGVVFRLKPKSNGSWTESVLHKFSKHAAFNPAANLVFDPAGNLYGTASRGEGSNGGVVFKLKARSGGGWAYSELHAFNFLDGDPGAHPRGGLVLDKASEIYGTTSTCFRGGKCQGVAFELIP